MLPTDVNFTSKITALTAENARMAVELGQWRDRAQKDSEARQNAEEQLQQSQTDLCAAQKHLGTIQQDNHELLSKSRHPNQRIHEYEKGVKDAFSLLQKLSSVSHKL